MNLKNITIGILLIIATCLGFLPSVKAESLSGIANWARLARVGGFDVDPEMSDQEVSTLMDIRKSENVSVLEVDSGLSSYMTDEEFQTQLTFFNNIAGMASNKNMRTVIYYPSLEVTTKNGENIAQTMYKEHPEWIQRGIDGTPNVFYGSQEVWVEPGMESAWMSPNTSYREYYTNRIRQLAVTCLDGVWVDVPIYLGTGTPWAGAEPAAAAAFNSWSKSQGQGGNDGYQVPTAVNWTDPAFRSWIRWRHENLADFVNAVRQAAHEVNPDFMVIIENFPADYMDATEAGLDGTYRRSNKN
ncbi:MAG: hypothetical protein D3924_06170, partial [Candidatus Electrothrix sp. AR4]|nr:hypothetical protein [Candidatus Electrothrix sp. AR4]